MTFWFTVMLFIVGSGDDIGKSRRYKTEFLEPAANFFHISLSTGSTLVGLFCNIHMKTIKISSADVCVCVSAYSCWECLWNFAALSVESFIHKF